MRKLTSGLLAGALAVGGTVALATVAPSIASANGCGNTVITDVNKQGWALPGADTRAAGYVNFRTDGGLDVGVTAQGSTGKATGYYAVNVPLAEQTAQSNYAISNLTGAETDPQGFSYQLGFDKDGNGTEDTVLVYEPRFYGQGVWHTSRTTAQSNTPGVNEFGVPEGLGYEGLGTLVAFSDANPDAKITRFGFSYGSSVPVGSVRVDSVTFGCNTFSFEKYVAPPAPNVPPVADFTGTQSGLTANFVGQSTDSDGTIVSYLRDR